MNRLLTWFSKWLFSAYHPVEFTLENGGPDGMLKCTVKLPGLRRDLEMIAKSLAYYDESSPHKAWLIERMHEAVERSLNESGLPNEVRGTE